MSRSRDGFHDPIPRGVFSAQLGAHLEFLLTTLSPDERAVLVLRFGLLDGVQRTLDETATALGKTRVWVAAVESSAIRLLRHPSRSMVVRDHLTDELSAGVLDRAREEGMHRSGSEVVFCARHGWVARDMNVRVCEQCPCRASKGRRTQRYCSDACRQAGYRHRRRAAPAP